MVEKDLERDLQNVPPNLKKTHRKKLNLKNIKKQNTPPPPQPTKERA